MGTAYTDLTIDQGADFETSLDLIADDGTAINIAGYIFSGQIRKSYYSANTSGSLEFTILDAANGNTIVSINSANTANIPAGRYVYDIKMEDTSNTITRVLEGIVTVTPQVTR
jgi:hypothetical protein